ncbi:NifB/NifX family molybdenum-iron cluster-binding protein [[Clostridium] hylemonae]|uniref:NifB/NifX family molybdenum-iron cluster-binding protein n=1 Tax=[Clostridium] hylemonae TaxID=89153 RepID=UPI001105E678|nr:NifB/NifX family molybdenum-iron cluster-binding protein [[Clostridium] hylemonae]
MARPGKSRRVGSMPRCLHFTASGSPRNGINLSVEEFETIRLMDYSGMTQAQCAVQMHVSRATIQSLYTQARKKLARFLVEGTYLDISGGDYTVCADSRDGYSCSRHMKINDDKGADIMKIAVTYEDGQIFQHFGHTKQFKIYEAEDGRIVSSEVKSTDGQGHGALATLLSDLGVDVLICGGIGGGARNALSEAGIDLYPGAVGEADAQAASFLAGTLSYDPDTMCSHHHGEEGHKCGSHGCKEHGNH